MAPDLLTQFVATALTAATRLIIIPVILSIVVASFCRFRTRLSVPLRSSSLGARTVAGTVPGALVTVSVTVDIAFILDTPSRADKSIAISCHLP
jgi:hypothetical protein